MGCTPLAARSVCKITWPMSKQRNGLGTSNVFLETGVDFHAGCETWQEMITLASWVAVGTALFDMVVAQKYY